MVAHCVVYRRAGQSTGHFHLETSRTRPAELKVPLDLIYSYARGLLGSAESCKIDSKDLGNV